MRSVEGMLNSGCGKTQQGKVRLAGREVAYTVRVSSRAKNLRLRVGAGCGLEVLAPAGFAFGDLDVILRKNESWILEKLDLVRREAEDKARSRQPGRWQVLYQGAGYEVETRFEAWASPGVVVGEGRLVVTLPEGSGDSAGPVLEGWLRFVARQLINRRLEVLSAKTGLGYQRVFIRDQKTRWGSCSRQGNLNFNWRLVMAPPEVLDYVIIHELMHLTEPNHSKNFWELVGRFCPDYRVHREWLKKNGKKLYI